MLGAPEVTRGRAALAQRLAFFESVANSLKIKSSNTFLASPGKSEGFTFPCSNHRACHIPPEPCISIPREPESAARNATVMSRHCGVRLLGSETPGGHLLSVSLGVLHPVLEAAGTVPEGSAVQALCLTHEVGGSIPVFQMRKHSSRRGAWRWSQDPDPGPNSMSIQLPCESIRVLLRRRTNRDTHTRV